MLTFPGNIKESVVTVYYNTKWFTRGPVSDKEWLYATTGEQGDDRLLTHYRKNSENWLCMYTPLQNHKKYEVAYSTVALLLTHFCFV